MQWYAASPVLSLKKENKLNKFKGVYFASWVLPFFFYSKSIASYDINIEKVQCSTSSVVLIT
jgi:hypothetical protein